MESKLDASQFLGSAEGRGRQLRELRVASKHWTHQLVKDAGARGGAQVHAKWMLVRVLCD